MWRCGWCLRRGQGAPTPVHRRARSLDQTWHRRRPLTATAQPRPDVFSRLAHSNATRPGPSQAESVIPRMGRGQHGQVQDSRDDRRPRLRPELRTELIYLRDPLKLGQRVQDLLRVGKAENALEMVRAASKSMECTVSWNFLVSHELQEGRIRGALKLYNEMKKRAQVPDAYTYSALFRGLVGTKHPKLALGKALSIYHSLHAPNSPVTPNIVHANSVLKVCARAGDMDSIWGIAAKLPERGRGAPDSVTWTTILNAIRYEAEGSVGSEMAAELAQSRRRRAIMEGRRLWSDIVGKWTAGDLRMDEELVWAMGKLLLMGESTKDWQDVLSLVTQTMNVPAFAPERPMRPENIKLLTTNEESISSDEKPAQEHVEDEKEPSDIPEESTEDVETGREFEVVVVNRSEQRGARSSISIFTYAQPGRSIISLVMEACGKLRYGQAATRFWEHFTGEQGLGIRPDVTNYHDYLRVLRISRASATAVTVLRRMRATPGITMASKAYTIALSACRRNTRAEQAFEQADEILDMAEGEEGTRLQGGGGGAEKKRVGAKLMSMYLDIAARTCTERNTSRIQTAIARLQPMFQRAMEQVRGEMDERRGERSSGREEGLEVEMNELLRLAKDLRRMKMGLPGSGSGRKGDKGRPKGTR